MHTERVYEIDPLVCARLGGQVKVSHSSIHGQQSEAMIGGLWHSSSARPPPAIACKSVN
jgi:hypothetical protein